MNPLLNLRLLTAADLVFADCLRALAGWNQTLDDWRRFLALQPDGCFLAEWEGSPAGTATTICYETELAWIGMVLVHPEYRGRGIGTALLQHCVEFLRRRGTRCIKLDATPQGRPLYASLGFRDEWLLSRWETNARKCLPSSAKDEVRPMRSSDWETITGLDALAFGVARRRLLKELAGQGYRVFVHESERPSVTGFGFARPGSRAVYLGPIVAASADVAAALLAVLTEASPGQTLFWDIPDENAVATTLAARLGFAIQRPLMRMYLGGNKHPGDPCLQFAIADPALG